MGLIDLFNGSALRRAEGKLAAQKLYNQNLANQQAFEQNRGFVNELLGQKAKPMGEIFTPPPTAQIAKGPMANVPQHTPGEMQFVDEAPQEGTGMFSQDPQDMIRSQMQLANLNPSAFQPMLTQTMAPAPAPKTERLYETEEKGYQPREAAIGLTKPSKPLTEVNIGQKSLDEWAFNTYRDAVEGADKAYQKATRLNHLNNILGEYRTGITETPELFMKKMAGALGVDAFKDEVAAKDAAQTEINKMVVDLMKPDSDTGKRVLAGQSSDKELEFFKQMVPSLSTSPTGRELIAKLAERRFQRMDAIAAMAESYQEQAEVRGGTFRPATFKRMVRERFKDADMTADLQPMLERALEEIKISETPGAGKPVRKQVNKRTGEVRYLDSEGNVIR